MADTPQAKDRREREQLDRDVAAATKRAGDELATANARRDRRAERAERSKLDRSVAEAQRAEGRKSTVITRHTWRADDEADELEGKAAVKAQQAAVVAAMDAENEARAEALGLPAPARYADGIP